MTRPDVGIDFWFSIGSTYTYLAAMRLPQVALRTGIAFRWRPFDVRAIMVEQKNLPFTDKPVKTAYMWRDIERRAAGYGLPFAGIPPYPIRAMARANRIALLAADEGWVVPYVQAVYRSWFIGRQEPAVDDAMATLLRSIGQDPARVIAMAEVPAIAERLADETSRAKALGVFGSPSFVVGSELFWGDDRLDDALAWARDGRLRNLAPSP